MQVRHNKDSRRVASDALKRDGRSLQERLFCKVFTHSSLFGKMLISFILLF